MKLLRLNPFAILFAFLLLFVAMQGCKEDSTTAPQIQKPTIVSFEANPASIPAGGDSVTLSWQVTGASSLSISPGVGNVTPIDSGSIKVFVSSATSFTLTATNTAGNTTASKDIAAELTITVNGVVKDMDDEPISGATVIIKGKQPVTTAGDGSFSFSNVNSPYEIRVILSTDKLALIYQGLTRSDPQLLYYGSTTTFKSASINGQVPPAAGKKTLVYFVSGNKSWSAFADENTGGYSIYPGWKGAASTYSGQLQVLRWTQNTSGLPVQYDAYGSKNLTISEGGTFNGNNFPESDFTDPAEQNISGSITCPSSSYSISSKHLQINFGNAFIYLSGENGLNLSENFSYMVPSISGSSFEVDVKATTGSRYSTYFKKGISAGASGVNIEIASAPQLNLPVNNGLSVDTTTQFLWTQGSGTGINLIIIAPFAPDMGPVFYIFTASNSTSIPNLDPLGLGLPSNVNYSWVISRYFPISSINDAASQFFIPMVNGFGGECGQSNSEAFSFTTK